MLSNVFFDLDGTLTDSQEGITKCLQYSLEKLGQPCLDVEELKRFIGPPLRSIFEKLLGPGDSLVEKAVGIYRERFSDIGLFENRVYPGVPEMLNALHRNSIRLAVVTTKPGVYAERIIAHFFHDKLFEGVFGAGPDGRFDSKIELVEFVLDYLKMSPGATLMVGDRKEDIMAEKSNGTKTLGVTYGYGSQQEIADSAHDFICNSPTGIKGTILRIR